MNTETLDENALVDVWSETKDETEVKWNCIIEKMSWGSIWNCNKKWKNSDMNDMIDELRDETNLEFGRKSWDGETAVLHVSDEA